MAMSRMSSTRRNTFIAVSVVLFHVAALWVLQTGLLRRAVEVFVPAEIISEFVEPPAPRTVKPAPPVPRPPVKMTPPPETRIATPEPAVIPEPTPAPNAPVVVAAPPPVVTQAAPAAPAPVTSLRVELPSSDAQYLQNPKPSYPAISKRLGEQGKVMVRVLIGVDGRAQKAEVAQSSGYERLDQAALNTVLAWRYVPGKRGGVPEAMWFNVPINFILE
jgi:periplasmic protein TonB